MCVPYPSNSTEKQPPPYFIRKVQKSYEFCTLIYQFVSFVPYFFSRFIPQFHSLVSFPSFVPYFFWCVLFPFFVPQFCSLLFVWCVCLWFRMNCLRVVNDLHPSIIKIVSFFSAFVESHTKVVLYEILYRVSFIPNILVYLLKLLRHIQ